MELKQDQLLVLNNKALNKFRNDHCIPKDVQIEHSRPNEIANFVESNGDCILVCIWLIHQAWLWFPISPMLKEVMAHCHLTFLLVFINFLWTMLVVDMLMHRIELPFSVEDLRHVYTIVWPKREPHSPLPQGNHYLCVRHPNHPQTRLVTGNSDSDFYGF